ncbi:MAG: hypothetical protein WAK53_17650, partial [Chromatiaceae bacterium]
FEQIRTGGAIAGWASYCSPAISKGQGRSSWGGLRNSAITVRDFGPAELLLRPRWSLRYPRERLISALPSLLSAPFVALRSAPAEALAVPDRTPWPRAVKAFLKLWRRYA